MEKRGRLNKRNEKVYFFIAINLLVLSVLINIEKDNNLTGRVVEQIYNFEVFPIEETTSSTSMISSSTTLPNGGDLKITENKQFGTLDFFIQATTDTVYDFQGITTPSSTFNATNGTNTINVPPNATIANGTEAITNWYTAISSSNDGRWNTSVSGFGWGAYGGPVRAWQIFKFELNVTPTWDIDSFAVKYEGYAAGYNRFNAYGGPAYGFNFSIWNNTGNVWYSLNISTAGTSDASIQRVLTNISDKLSDFIYSSNGRNYTFFAVITNGTNGTSTNEQANISTDYVSLTASVTTTTSSTSTSTTLPHANLTLYLRNSTGVELYKNITALTNETINITSVFPYPADVNMTLYVMDYAGINQSRNISKSFLENFTTFWTPGSFLINISWEGNLTFFGNSTAFWVDVLSTTTTSSTSSSSTTVPRANLTLYLRNSTSTIGNLYKNITALTNESINITSSEPYPADVNMTLYVTNYVGVNASFNYSKSFLQNFTTFWTEGNYLINITWEGNLTLQPNSTAFYVTVLATTTTTSTSSSSTTVPRANLTLYLRNSTSTIGNLYKNITALTNESINITSSEPYPADVNMTLYVTNYVGVNASFNYSKSFLQNFTTFWTTGSFLINITWEGNLTMFGNSTAFWIDVNPTTTTSSTSSSTTSTSTSSTSSSTTASSGEPEPTPSLGGGSSSGSGGGTRISEIVQKPNEAVYSIPLLVPGELNIAVGDPYSNIVSVLLNINREVSNSQISVKNIDIPPSGIILYGNNALDYYEISKINMPDSAITEVIINYKYKKSEPASLFVYSDERWNELASREIKSDDYYTYYEAISNKLGYFVISKKITGEKIILESEPIETKLVKNIKIIKDKIKTIGRGDKVAVIVVINMLLLIFIGVAILIIFGIKKLRKRR